MSSKQERKQLTAFPTSTSMWIESECHKLVNLPEPGEPWLFKEVDLPRTTLYKCSVEGVIQRTHDGRRNEDGRMYFETTEKGWNAIQKYNKIRKETDRLLPCSDPECPGRGFTNLGDVLECKYCGEIHDKSEVRS